MSFTRMGDQPLKPEFIVKTLAVSYEKYGRVRRETKNSDNV